MSAFLWLDDNSQLIKRANDKYVPAKLDTLSDDDIAALEIGIQGDNDLLRAEYDKVHEQMLSGLLRLVCTNISPAVVIRRAVLFIE